MNGEQRTNESGSILDQLHRIYSIHDVMCVCVSTTMCVLKEIRNFRSRIKSLLMSNLLKLWLYYDELRSNLVCSPPFFPFISISLIHLLNVTDIQRYSAIKWDTIPYRINTYTTTTTANRVTNRIMHVVDLITQFNTELACYRDWGVEIWFVTKLIYTYPLSNQCTRVTAANFFLIFLGITRRNTHLKWEEMRVIRSNSYNLLK